MDDTFCRYDAKFHLNEAQSIQAEKELDDNWTLMKDRLPTKPVETWLLEVLNLSYRNFTGANFNRH